MRRGALFAWLGVGGALIVGGIMKGIGTNTYSRDATSEARLRVVACAENELDSTDPRPYWTDALGYIPEPMNRYAWCGVFALYCLRRAGLVDWKWIVGRGFVYKDGKQRLPIVTKPEPGDVAYFDQPYQHYAIVEAVGSDGVHVIAGNTPNVSRSVVPAGRDVVYYSIANLLPA
jgi:hypothetical protein